MANEIIDLTEKQLDSFPIKEIKIGTKNQKVRFDEITKRMYLLDENGVYTGKSAVWTRPEPQTVQAEPPEDDELDAVPLEIEIPDETVSETGDNDGDSDTESKKIPLQKPSKITAILLFILAGIILIVIGAIILGVVKGISKSEAGATEGFDSSTTTPSTSLTINSTATDPSDTTSNTQTEPILMISVLVPDASVMPGQPMKDIPLTFAQIPENEYKLLSAVTKVYTETEMLSVQEMVAAKYIEAGKYLTSGDLAMMYQPVNPWEALSAGDACVTIPVQVEPSCLADLLWGNQVNIKITYTTSYGSSPTPDGTQTPEGVLTDSTMVESTLVTTYLFRGAVIRDALDANGESLYAEYEKRTLLPTPVLAGYLDKRYEDAAASDDDMPRSLSVALTQEQFELFAALDIEAMTIEVERVAASCDTALQSEVYTKLREVGQLTAQAMSKEGQTDDAAA